MNTDQAKDYSSPESRGVCGFCGGEEGGYAKQDANGKWQAACWHCVKPNASGLPQPKRKLIGMLRAPEVDADAEEIKTAKSKAPGMAPSTHRPKVN